MARTLITGTIAYDVLLGFEGSFLDTIKPAELATLSVSHFAPHYTREHGGTGANIAWTLRLLGGDPLLVGAVGSDGREYLAHLRDAGVDVSYVAEVEGQVTATAIIGTDSGARQIAFFHPGADSHSPWPDLSKERDGLGMAIVSPRDQQAMTRAVDWCASAGVSVLFDPGQQVHAFGPDEMERMVRKSAGVIVNEYEWNILRTTLNRDEAGVLELCPLLIVTLAERGVMIVDAEGPRIFAACSADHIVNPTGAGDALRAGVLRGLDAGWSIDRAVQLGAGIASFVVEIDGTLLPELNADALRTRMTQTYGEALPPITF
jgi:adenosine kinase